MRGTAFNGLASRAFKGRRYISVTQTSVVSNIQAETSHNNEPETVSLDYIETQGASSNSTTQFQVIGTPPSLISLQLTPSVPVYIRRGALVSLQTNVISSGEARNNTVGSVLEWLSPWKNILYMGLRSSSKFERLVSTVPYTALVSSVAKNFWNTKVASQRSLVNVVMDGRVDWAVLPRNALQVYSGPSLQVSIEKAPSRISNALANVLKIPKSSSTGLSSNWFIPRGFVFASGRGQISLSGTGQIYRIILKQNEEYLVKRDNILAVSVNGETDLANCMAAHTLGKAHKISTSPESQDTVVAAKPELFWNKVISRVSFYTSTVSSAAYNAVVGNSDYIKVVGPRNVLVQTNSNVQLTNALKSFTVRDSDINNTELKIKSVQELDNPTLTGSSFLKIATVTDGKVEFKSTENFNDAVKKIEQRA